MPTRSESVVLLVDALARELPDDLEWLRRVVVGERASDRELVAALCSFPVSPAAEVLAEARLVKLRRERGV